ncbi:MAG: hypothetical protein SFZ03_09215 [Candidatus Melainabacteria bacterium]|nr:hypothetical protein [Candidatus Melainabacteria bacterium]
MGSVFYDIRHSAYPVCAYPGSLDAGVVVGLGVTPPANQAGVLVIMPSARQQSPTTAPALSTNALDALDALMAAWENDFEQPPEHNNSSSHSPLTPGALQQQKPNALEMTNAAQIATNQDWSQPQLRLTTADGRGSLLQQDNNTLFTYRLDGLSYVFWSNGQQSTLKVFDANGALLSQQQSNDGQNNEDLNALSAQVLSLLQYSPNAALTNHPGLASISNGGLRGTSLSALAGNPPALSSLGQTGQALYTNPTASQLLALSTQNSRSGSGLADYTLNQVDLNAADISRSLDLINIQAGLA